LHIDAVRMIREFEAKYDSDCLETEMGDPKQWAEERGFHPP